MQKESNKSRNELKNTYKTKLAINLTKTLKKQGFKIDGNFLKFNASSKEKIRKLHSVSVKYLLEKNRKFIKENDSKFLEMYVADGDDINPKEIDPKLVIVDNEKNSLVFKWVKLHWSIPISSGYGRRIRYLVKDKHTDKLIGIIGLGDPVYALKDRDGFIGWSSETKSRKLKNIMDAFVLGAIPPYNRILGGKLVAALISSKEVSKDFKKKYKNKKSLIRGDIFDGKFAGITTSSALGKSSVYDRIKISDGAEFLHVGWTCGSGDFQFLNSYYKDLLELVKSSGYTGKNKKWGTGVRNRRVVVKQSLNLLGLPSRLIYHGIKRELFFVPLGKNWKRFLCGETTRLDPYGLSVAEISEFIKNRWIIPRSERDASYLEFTSKSYSLSHSCKLELSLISS